MPTIISCREPTINASSFAMVSWRVSSFPPCAGQSTAFALGDRFKAGSVGAHRVDELGWSTHGWRLAAGKRRKTGRNERVGAWKWSFVGAWPSGDRLFVQARMPQIVYNLACDGFLLDAAFVVEPKHATFKGRCRKRRFSVSNCRICENYHNRML